MRYDGLSDRGTVAVGSNNSAQVPSSISIRLVGLGNPGKQKRHCPVMISRWWNPTTPPKAFVLRKLDYQMSSGILRRFASPINGLLASHQSPVVAVTRTMTSTVSRRADPFKPAARVAGQRPDVWYATARDPSVSVPPIFTDPPLKVDRQRGRSGVSCTTYCEYGPRFLVSVLQILQIEC